MTILGFVPRRRGRRSRGWKNPPCKGLRDLKHKPAPVGKVDSDNTNNGGNNAGHSLTHAHYRHNLSDKCKDSKIKFSFQFPTLGGFFYMHYMLAMLAMVALAILYQLLTSIAASAERQKMA